MVHNQSRYATARTDSIAACTGISKFGNVVGMDAMKANLRKAEEQLASPSVGLI
jgi:hypothetical protein